MRAAIRGEVRFEAAARGAYSTDASNYRQIPIGVVIPRSVDDVVAAVRICREFDAPITCRGGGTSLAGQTCNFAVIFDFSKYMHRILEIDPEEKTARVEPGCILDDLRHAAESQFGLTYGPDPATHNRNTLGGMIGNNSCGTHSVMAQLYGYGPMTKHQVVELEVLTYDGTQMRIASTTEEEARRIASEGGRRGEIYTSLLQIRDEHVEEIRRRMPDIPRRVSGYNLDSLLPENGFNLAQALVGTEGTCVIVLGAKVRLMASPKARALVALGYPDAYTAADHVTEVMARRPIALEGIDHRLISYMKRKKLHPRDTELLPEGEGWLLVEFGGDTRDEARGRAQELVDDLKDSDQPPHAKIFDDADEEAKLWEIRESGLGATAHVPGMPTAHPGWEDASVPPDRLGEYLRDFRKLLDEFGYDAALYGHFGQGCVHCRIDFDLDSTNGIAEYRRFIDRAADLVVGYGGSLSGEHGDGQARAALLEKMYGPELVAAFRKFKAAWDPAGKMNPGKVVDPYKPTENLRRGADYTPRQLETHFAFLDDNGSFIGAADRCVGVGKCRREDDGTMCPSYMATREEIHSTRGRARLLFEMTRGDFIQDAWKSKAVKEALDLCLACKGCKSDCPVNVDMATYKAEFLSHYYAGKLRPRVAYAMGLIYWWARLASHAPRVVNFFTQHEFTARWLKKAGGIAEKRQIPPFAAPTFRDWFREHRRNRVPVSLSLQKPVVLWPDTFNNYLTTGPAIAAVEVLEAAGYTVHIPPKPLCCGRPLYDYGMLGLADRLWKQTIRTLRPALRAGVPIVGLEPSCVAAFRDELPNLRPNDVDAQRLTSQTYLLSEFLQKEGYEPPPLNQHALVHGHCHHKSVLDFGAELSLLDKTGLDYELPDTGCCGMAGSFGFEAEKYDVSIAAGERVLLPAVRNESPDGLLIADGFSCREQIEQTTGRKARHLSEVLAGALQREDTPHPERNGHVSVEAEREIPRQPAATSSSSTAEWRAPWKAN